MAIHNSELTLLGVIQKGTTSRNIHVILDSATTGHASYTAKYIRPGQSSMNTIGIVEGTLGSWTSGGLKHVEKGLFQFSCPDEVLSTGNMVTVVFSTSTDDFFYRIQLVDYDPNDIMRMGLTALPNVVPAANGGLPTVDASNYVAGIQGTKNQLDDLTDITAAQVNAQCDTAIADVGLTTTITGRIDAAMSTRATPAQVGTAVATELATYDPPTRAELSADKSEILSAISEALPGTGDVVYTYNVVDTSDDPIYDVQVIFTSDADGTAIVASGRTDSAGDITVYLDAGTYYVWLRKAGYDFENPYQVTIAWPFTIDGFETGEIDSYTGDTDAYSVVSSPVHDGLKALQLTIGAVPLTNKWLISTAGLPLYPRRGYTFEFWVRWATGGRDVRLYFGFIDDENSYHFELRDNDFAGLFSVVAGVTTDIATFDPGVLVAGDWYRVVIEWGQSGIMRSRLYDDSGTLIGTAAAGDSTYNQGGIAWLGTNLNNQAFAPVFDSLQVTDRA